MNVVIGSNAMAFAALGNFNIGIGHQVAQESTAANNTIVGYQAGQYNTTGGNNTMVGYEAGRNTTTGTLNTCIGYAAGSNLTTGNNNITIGGAANGSTTGSSNTIIGVSSSIGNTFRSNVTLLGYAAVGTGSSNQITLGNSSISTLRCAVTSITSLSDERDKTEIKDLGYGLSFIDALQA